MCKVYTGYCGTSEIEHGLCACTVDNPLAKARGLSLRTGAQTTLYLSLVEHQAHETMALLVKVKEDIIQHDRLAINPNPRSTNKKREREREFRVWYLLLFCCFTSTINGKQLCTVCQLKADLLESAEGEIKLVAGAVIELGTAGL